MHSNGNGENEVSVPAALGEQLQNLTTKSGDNMQFAPGAPNPTPRPVSPNLDYRTDD
jgi:hypothetical protein